MEVSVEIIDTITNNIRAGELEPEPLEKKNKEPEPLGKKVRSRNR